MRYWTAECTYDGKTPFYFYSPDFCVAETETEAESLLRNALAREWAKISPHPAPRLLAVVPGSMVLQDRATVGRKK